MTWLRGTGLLISEVLSPLVPTLNLNSVSSFFLPNCAMNTFQSLPAVLPTHVTRTEGVQSSGYITEEQVAGRKGATFSDRPHFFLKVSFQLVTITSSLEISSLSYLEWNSEISIYIIQPHSDQEQVFVYSFERSHTHTFLLPITKVNVLIASL